jgi:hypothetical protein
MLLYTRCLTRQALFALPWMAELHAKCHTHKRCVTVLQCRRARAEVWKRILRLHRYPLTRPRGCGPSFVCAPPFLPAGQRAAAGAKRGLRHTRNACTHGRQKRAIRADPPSVTRPGVDRSAVVAGSGAACIRCAPRVSQHHARVCRLSGRSQARPAGKRSQARPAGKHAKRQGPSHVQPHSCGSLPARLP